MPLNQDYLMRDIERLSQALGAILNRLLKGENVVVAEINADLSRTASRVGVNLELARQLAPESLLGMVSSGEKLDSQKCWALAEIFFLDGMKCEKAGELHDAFGSYERSLFLYSKVQESTMSLPQPTERIKDIEARIVRLDDQI